MAVVTLTGLRLDAVDAPREARFWAGVLGWQVDERDGGVIAVAPAVPADATNYPIVIHPTHTPKQGQNRIHLDLTSQTWDAKEATVSRARSLGGRSVNIGQAPNETHEVMADPEGNEFCVIEPDNRFLAGTGVVGAVNCDGSQAVGRFWAQALGWPLVWDQDEETAIQSPQGGSKLTWSGPPLMPRHGRDRWRFHVRAIVPMDEAITELTALGAELTAPAADSWALLTDPDGNAFHLEDSNSIR